MAAARIGTRQWTEEKLGYLAYQPLSQAPEPPPSRAPPRGQHTAFTQGGKRPLRPDLAAPSIVGDSVRYLVPTDPTSRTCFDPSGGILSPRSRARLGSPTSHRWVILSWMSSAAGARPPGPLLAIAFFPGLGSFRKEASSSVFLFLLRNPGKRNCSTSGTSTAIPSPRRGAPLPALASSNCRLPSVALPPSLSRTTCAKPTYILKKLTIKTKFYKQRTRPVIAYSLETCIDQKRAHQRCTQGTNNSDSVNNHKLTTSNIRQQNDNPAAVATVHKHQKNRHVHYFNSLYAGAYKNEFEH